MKQVLKQLIDQAIEKAFGAEFVGHAGMVLSHPPDSAMGDYASNTALVLAKALKKNPKEVAEQLVAAISNFQFPISNKFPNSKALITNIQIVGGFINFALNSKEWAKEVLGEVSEQQAEYGKSRTDKPEKIMVEYLSPNTNKPLHVGHFRNGVIGSAVSNLLQVTGHEVVKVQIINDRGIAICKSMLAWMKWGEGKTPKDAGVKPDHFVGDWYVRFAQEEKEHPEIQEEAQELLRRWEAGDAEVRQVWEMMNEWIYEGWKETIDILGFTEDKKYYESEVFQLGKDIVSDGLSRGVFKSGEGKSVLFDLPENEFGKDQDGTGRKSTLVRPDGTSVYITQDVGLAVKRAAEYHADRLVYITGSEQRYHFQTLFAILKALGYEWAQHLLHIWYGMVYLPHGKMKSREGTVVDADDLVATIENLARKEIESRNKDEDARLERTELETRARVIALAAIKFYLLKHKPSVDIHYNPEESISFEGNTGPYCLYTYARGRSILRTAKLETRNSKLETHSILNNIEERILIRQLEEFPEIVQRAAGEYNPALITTFVFETCQAFNTFYTKHQVLKAESDEIKTARLELVGACSQVIQNGLNLLGIETVEEM